MGWVGGPCPFLGSRRWSKVCDSRSITQVLQRYRQRFDEDARDLQKTVVSECGGPDDDVCGEVAAARWRRYVGPSKLSRLVSGASSASVCGAVALHNALSALLTSRVDPSVLIK